MGFLFGEGQYGLRFLFAFVLVLGLIGLTAWLVRRFGSERLGTANARGRQPRLAVIDAATVDGRRRLILIRRDNVEHLLMIGGPTDVVVEPNIVRAAAAREAGPPRAAVAPDALLRAVPFGEGGMWPLQPEPAPVPSPAPRPQRPAPIEEPAPRAADIEPPLVPPRHARQVDPLAGLAAELSRQPGSQPAAPRLPREREAAREAPPSRTPQPAGAEAPSTPMADQNLAEMAQRLEAALRRSPRPDVQPEAKPRAAAAPAATAVPPAPEPEPESVTEPEPTPQITADARPVRSDAGAMREARAAAPKTSVYDSLEQEMASLLGRPTKT